MYKTQIHILNKWIWLHVKLVKNGFCITSKIAFTNWVYCPCEKNKPKAGSNVYFSYKRNKQTEMYK